jgi:hypothetical protein
MDARQAGAAALAMAAVLLAGCVVQADGRPVPLRVDVFNEGGADLGPVELVVSDLHGGEEMVLSGPVARNATVSAALPPGGAELRVRVGGRETGRTVAGDCLYPQVSVLLEPFPRHQTAVHVDIRSHCPPVAWPDPVYAST